MYYLKSNNTGPRILLMGGGVVGSAIRDKFLSSGYYQHDKLTINWGADNRAKLNLLLTFFSKNSEFIEDHASDQTILIWAAGAAGFNASEEQANDENIFYEAAIDVISSLIASKKNIILKIYYISSIGGLFEGQHFIDETSKPAPLRPYGKLKVSQEAYLDSKDNIACYIFRLSSVYSYIDKNKRMGLVQTLIQNGMRREASCIYGSLDTLRDYIWAEDVAQAIYYASQAIVLDRKLFHLTSGVPISISKIKCLIESILRRPLILTYKFDKHNSLNICCKYNRYSGLWKPSDIMQNLYKIYNNKLSK